MRQSKNYLKIVFFFTAGFLFFSLFSHLVFAQDIGSQTIFYVESDYDNDSRTQLNAVLVYQTSKLNIYVDTRWWNSLTPQLQNQINAQIFYLTSYFENYDYQKIVATFGSEAVPGLDNDSRIYILIHPMKQNYLGYARFVDSLPAGVGNDSNQHEMVYLSPEVFLNAPANQLGYYLSHEVLHLISFNQKGIFINSEDERWLSEARSDYLSTFLGYNNILSGSLLEKRLNALRQNSNFSLLDFKGTASDYAAAHLFAEYLVEKYGIKILVDSMRSKLTGIASLNDALAKNGYSEDFNEVFKNWLIAMAFNDCSLGKKYCFENPNLNGFHIYPYTNYLPEYGVASLTANNYLNLYAGTWIKITGGKGNLKVGYEFPQDAQYVLSYVIVDQDNNKIIKFFSSKDGYKGTINVADFGANNIALYLIPFITNSSSNSVFFKWEASTAGLTPGSSTLIETLTQRIAQLKAQVAMLTAQLNALLGQKTTLSCYRFQNDLYYGIKDSLEVKCLQKLLFEREPQLYSTGLITGNFLNLTQEAIRKYQQKYGLPATGYFGPLTRALANKQWFGY